MKQKKWNLIHIPKNKEVRIVDENGSTILKNHSLSFPPDPCVPNLTEDWHLIAAAPEMLEALESFLYPDNPDDWQDALIEQIPRLRDIVTKAKGEHQ